MSRPTAAFVVERYWPDPSLAEFERTTGRLAARIAELTTDDVALLHSTYVLDDEAAQWVIRAPSADAVRALCAGIGLAFDRLLPAVESARSHTLE
jgi:hypothetical protein